MLQELKNELKISLENDTLKKDIKEIDVNEIIKASIEAAAEATEYLAHQIIKNNEFKEKYGVKATLEYYDFKEDEIRLAIEAHGEDKVVGIINNKFLSKIGTFFSNIIKAIKEGFRKFINALTNPAFIAYVNDVIHDLEKSGSQVPKDAKIDKKDLDKYYKEHQDELKVAVIRGAKTLSKAQLEIILSFNTTAKGLEFIDKLLENMITTSTLLNSAAATYATASAIKGDSEVKNAVKIAVKSTLDTVDFIEKYNRKNTDFKEWLNLPEIKKYNKNKSDALIPFGIDGKNLRLLKIVVNEDAYNNLKEGLDDLVNKLSKTIRDLENLWYINEIKVPLKSIDVEIKGLKPTIMTIDEMTDMIDVYGKVDKSIMNKIYDIGSKLEDIKKHDYQSRNMVLGQYYNPQLEKIIVMLFSYRGRTFNQIYKVDPILVDILDEYFAKLPVVKDYLEMIRKYYTIEDK